MMTAPYVVIVAPSLRSPGRRSARTITDFLTSCLTSTTERRRLCDRPSQDGDCVIHGDVADGYDGGYGGGRGGRGQCGRRGRGRRHVRVQQTGRGTDPPGDPLWRYRAPGPQRTGPAPARHTAATALVGRWRSGVDRAQPMGCQTHVRARHDNAIQRFHACGTGAQDPQVVAGSAAQDQKVSTIIAMKHIERRLKWYSILELE